MSSYTSQFENPNPLDRLEDIFVSQDWIFSRPAEDELAVEIAGQKGDYIMHFVWNEDYQTLKLHCNYDLEIPHQNREIIMDKLPDMNDELVLGNFAVPSGTGIPEFTYTILTQGHSEKSCAAQIQTVVNVAYRCCEQYHSFFQLMSSSHYISPDLVDLAMVRDGGYA